MKHYTHDEWIAGAVLDDGVYWRESNGESVEVASNGFTHYGLRGGARGSITVRAFAGSAISYRCGDGEGYAIETDRRGTRRKVDAPSITYTCAAGDGWLRVGCELHDLATWVRHATTIDACHGGGIADLTRALAERLMRDEVSQ